MKCAKALLKEAGFPRDDRLLYIAFLLLAFRADEVKLLLIDLI
jgi:hypothetical protein